MSLTLTDWRPGRQSYENWVVQLLEAEAEIRVLAGWAANIGIPRLDDGRWVLVNQTAAEKAVEDAKTALHKREMAKPEDQRLSTPAKFAEMQKIQQLIAPEMCK